MPALPDLEAWAVFARVVETGSFARAAQSLSLSQGTVSKAVARLEARLGVTLLLRTSRRMALTESGEAALDRAARILEEGESLEAEVGERSAALRGPVRVAVPMSFGIAHLAPALPAFMNAHPEVQLDVDFSDAQVDLVANRFDMAVRIAALEDSTLLARRLCTVRILLVGSARYFREHGRPAHPRELGAHRALRYAYARDAQWRFRHARHGEWVPQLQTALQVNNADALMPPLLAGLGLALQPEFLVWDALRTGKLQTALDHWSVAPVGLHLVTPPGRRRPARVQAFMEHLAAHFAAAPWARPGGPGGIRPDAATPAT